MTGLGCSVKSCTFSKMGIDGTHGTRVFHWSLNSILQNFIAQKKVQQRFIYCEQPKLSVLWCQKKQHIERETSSKH